MKTIKTLFNIVFFLIIVDVIIMVGKSEWRPLIKVAVIGLIVLFYLGVYIEGQARRDEQARQEVNRRRLDNLKDKP